jgi:hypothetical protein
MNGSPSGDPFVVPVPRLAVARRVLRDGTRRGCPQACGVQHRAGRPKPCGVKQPRGACCACAFSDAVTGLCACPGVGRATWMKSGCTAGRGPVERPPAAGAQERARYVGGGGCATARPPHGGPRDRAGANAQSPCLPPRRVVTCRSARAAWGRRRRGGRRPSDTRLLGGSDRSGGG